MVKPLREARFIHRFTVYPVLSVPKVVLFRYQNRRRRADRSVRPFGQGWNI